MAQNNKANGFVIVQRASSSLIYITGLLFLFYLNIIINDVCWEHGFLRAFYTVPRLMALKMARASDIVEPTVYCKHSLDIPCFLHQSVKVQDPFVDSFSIFNSVVSFFVDDINENICLFSMHVLMVFLEYALSPFRVLLSLFLFSLIGFNVGLGQYVYYNVQYMYDNKEETMQLVVVALLFWSFIFLLVKKTFM